MGHSISSRFHRFITTLTLSSFALTQTPLPLAAPRERLSMLKTQEAMEGAQRVGVEEAMLAAGRDVPAVAAGAEEERGALVDDDAVFLEAGRLYAPDRTTYRVGTLSHDGQFVVINRVGWDGTLGKIEWKPLKDIQGVWRHEQQGNYWVLTGEEALQILASLAESRVLRWSPDINTSLLGATRGPWLEKMIKTAVEKTADRRGRILVQDRSSEGLYVRPISANEVVRPAGLEEQQPAVAERPRVSFTPEGLVPPGCGGATGQCRGAGPVG